MRTFLFAACAVLAGCAAEPVPYHSGNEIPQGPGLLSGPEGAFVFRSGEYQEYLEWRKQRDAK